jgi:hypothetical protein
MTDINHLGPRYPPNRLSRVSSTLARYRCTSQHEMCMKQIVLTLMLAMLSSTAAAEAYSYYEA